MSGELEINGKRFISARRAAEITKYSADYVGQLCRGGKVNAKMVGRSWYVEADSLLEYQDAIEAVREEQFQSLANKLHARQAQVALPSSEGVHQHNVSGLYQSFASEEDGHPLIPLTEKDVTEPLSKESSHSQSKENNPPQEETSPSSHTLLSSPLHQKALAGALSLLMVAGGLWISDASRITRASTMVFDSVQSLPQAFAKRFLNGKDRTKTLLSSINRDVALMSAFSGEEWRDVLAFATERVQRNFSTRKNFLTTFIKEGIDSVETGTRAVAVSLKGAGSQIVNQYQSANVYDALESGFRSVLKKIVGIFTPSSQDTEKSLVTLPEVETNSKGPPAVEERGAPIDSRVVVIEREVPVRDPAPPSISIVERIREPIVISGISSEEFERRFQELGNEIRSSIYTIVDASSSNTTRISGLSRTVTLTNKIDQLSGIDISNSDITGGTISGARLSNINFPSLGTSGLLDVSGSGTSTIAGGLDLGTLNTTNLNSTSTFSGGLSVSGGIKISTLNCTGFGNGGALSTDANGNVICSDDDSGGGGGGGSSFGKTFELGTDKWGVSALAPTTTVPLLVESTATSTFYGGIEVANLAVPGYATFDTFSATSTTATSTITHGLLAGGLRSSNGLTISGGNLLITSSATSTSNNGFNITAGCFSVNGTCVTGGGGGSGTINSGTTNRLSYYSGATTLDSASFLATDITNRRFGISTSSPYAKLSIGNNAVTETLLALDAPSGQTASILDVKIASTTKFVIDSGGRAGVGTTSPWALLSVNPDGITGPSFAVGSSTKTDFLVANSGNVGVGTVHPFSGLHVWNDLVLSGNASYLSAAQLGIYPQSLATREYVYSRDVSNVTNGNLTSVDSDDQGGEARNVWGDGKFVYLANGTAGLHVYSVDTNGNLTHVDSDDQGGIAEDVWGDGNFIYLANNTTGLLSYSVASSGVVTHIDTLGSVGTVENVWGDGKFIYTANNSDGLYSYSVDANGNLSNIDSDDQGGEARDVWGDGDFIYLANGTQGLLSYSVDANGNLRYIDSDDQGDLALGVWGDGDFIYVTNDTGGLRTYSVDNAGNLTYIDSDDPGDFAFGVWGDGKFIYLANHSGGLHTYSVDASGNLTRIDSDDQGDQAWGVWGDGKFVYLANYTGGLRTYSINYAYEHHKGLAQHRFTGNVGIGTTTPGTILSVQGVGNFTTGTSTFYGGVTAGAFNATSTTATSTFAGLAITSGGLKVATLAGSESCLQVNSDGTVTTSGAGCGSSFGKTFELGTDKWGVSALAPTTTVPLLVESTATSTFYGGIEVANLAVPGYATFDTFSATSTTATSTITHGLLAGGLRSSNGLTISGGNLLITSSATSTSNNGFNITAGCFSVNGTCVTGGGGGSGTINSGTTNRLSYYSGATTLDSASFLATDITNSRLGIGTTTPYARLSVNGNTALDSRVIDFASSSASTLTLNYRTAATSTIPLSQKYAYTIATSTTASPIFRIDTSLTNTKATSSFTGGFEIDNGAFRYTHSSGITAIDSLELGALSFDTNAGVVSWVDLPVTSASASSTRHSYSAQIDNNPILTVYGESNGSGGTELRRVGIGTTTPGATLNVLGSLCVDDNTPTCANAPRADGTIYSVSALSATLDLAEKYGTKDATLSAGEIVSLDGDNNFFVSRAARSATGTPIIGIVSTKPGFYLGGYNDEIFEGEHTLPIALSGRVPLQVNLDGGEIRVGDRIALSTIPGVGMKATTTGLSVGTALEGFSATSTVDRIEVFVDLNQYIAPHQFSIDSLTGNVGIGTTTPSYELHVVGEVAANAFINVSTKSSKKDITYFTEEDTRSITEKIRDIKVANYRYVSEGDSGPERIGLIAEDSPEEILSVDGKGVDIYQLSTLILVGVQEHEMRLENIEVRLAEVEELIAQGKGGGLNLKATLEGLASLGVKISNGVAEMRNLMASALTVGTKEKPSGITLFDEVTGEPYCLKIVNGNPQTTPGSCAKAGSPSGTSGEDTEAPVITINGKNPSRVEVGQSYTDLGAMVTDNVNNNLGIQTTGAHIDTSIPGEHVVIYTATDQAGNTATSTRQVIVFDPREENALPPSDPEGAVIETPEPEASTATSTESGESDLEPIPQDEPIDATLEDPVVEEDKDEIEVLRETEKATTTPADIE